MDIAHQMDLDTTIVTAAARGLDVNGVNVIKEHVNAKQHQKDVSSCFLQGPDMYTYSNTITF